MYYSKYNNPNILYKIRLNLSSNKNKLSNGMELYELNHLNLFDYNLMHNYIVMKSLDNIFVAPLDRNRVNILNINNKRILVKVNNVTDLAID